MIAAWQVRPPFSVMIAAARFIAGTKSGVVISATSTSPSAIWWVCAGSATTRTRPAATPGLAAEPLNSGSACGVGAASRSPADWTTVVIGRVCSR